MTAIERTAYPRFKQSLTQRELEEFYAPTEAEVVFVHLSPFDAQHPCDADSASHNSGGL